MTPKKQRPRRNICPSCDQPTGKASATHTCKPRCPDCGKVNPAEIHSCTPKAIRLGGDARVRVTDGYGNPVKATVTVERDSPQKRGWATRRRRQKLRESPSGKLLAPGLRSAMRTTQRLQLTDRMKAQGVSARVRTMRTCCGGCGRFLKSNGTTQWCWWCEDV